MAKKNTPITISRAELAKLPRNEQRRMLDLGYVEAEAPKSEAKK